MEKVSDIVVLPNNSVYKPGVGQFGIQTNNRIKWHHCREQFHFDMLVRFWNDGFYFSHSKGQRDLIAEFIGEIENILDLEDRTKLFMTNIPSITFIKPSPFWFSQTMRLSLFTIFIRASLHHNRGRNIESTMNDEDYLRRTSRAVKMFLSGRNRYTGWNIFKGWYSVFSPVQCCGRTKCRHRDRRCRRFLDAKLVPWWQFFPLNLIFQGYRWVRWWTGNLYRFMVQSD